MIYKTLSSKAIIQKVFRDLKPSDTSWTNDAVEWIGEALDFIGYHAGFEKRVKSIKVKNFRAEIPCDLYQLFAVEYKGSPLAYGSDLTAYDQSRTTNMSPLGTDSDATVARFQTTPGTIQNSPTGQSTFAQAKSTVTRRETGDYYVINPNYVVTSFEEGDIKLHYDGYPLDDCGFPMIPDNIYYKQALEWYIIRQMMMGGYKNENFNWQIADQQWKHYCVAAQNDAAYPSIDKMESFKNMWVRLVPNINAHADFFMGNQTQERLRR